MDDETRRDKTRIQTALIGIQLVEVHAKQITVYLTTHHIMCNVMGMKREAGETKSLSTRFIQEATRSTALLLPVVGQHDSIKSIIRLEAT